MSQPVTAHFARVAARCRQGVFPATVGLLWKEREPHQVVTMIAPVGKGGVVTWRLDRLTLAAGLDGPVGIGDWSLMPDLSAADGEGVELVLASGGVGRHVALALPVTPLRRFLDLTFAVVPAGAEQLNLDALPRLRQGGAAA